MPTGVTVLILALAAVLLLLVLEGCQGDHKPSLNQRAYSALHACLTGSNAGPRCYDLPIVREAIRAGWDAPSAYQVLEGSGYHE